MTEQAFPPPSFFLKERGYTNYEMCCHDCHDDSSVADGIDAFVEVRSRSPSGSSLCMSQLSHTVVFGQDKVALSTTVYRNVPACQLNLNS